MKKVILLFLALLAQGEDLHLKLSELPSAPEVNWLTTNEVAMQMATSGRQVKLASENSEWSGLSDLPVVTATEWTTEEEILRMVNRRQVSLAYNGDMPKQGFPDRLGIGSREELRDFIVAVRGMGMNVWLTLEYQKTTGSYFQMKVGRFSDGYSSFDAMLQDLEAGLNILIGQVKEKADYKQGTDVWAQVTVTYFNDVSAIRPKPFGLVITRKQGTRDTLNAKNITESFASLDEYNVEVMVAKLPTISRFEMQLSLTNNLVATMTWTKQTGVQLASWPREYPEDVTENYIAISGWLCDGTHPMRIKVTANGEQETYTEHGERLLKPTIISLEDKDTLVINGPRGADIWVQSTTDWSSWTDRGIVSDVTGRLFLDFPNEGGKMMIFRAGVK